MDQGREAPVCHYYSILTEDSYIKLLHTLFISLLINVLISAHKKQLLDDWSIFGYSMPMNAITQSRTGDTRHHILSVAKTLILGKGFSAVGLNEILKTAEVPKGSFYHYFDSKEHFGTALLENYFDEYLATLDIALNVSSEKAALQLLLNYFDNWKNSQCSDITNDKCLVVKLSGEVSDLSEAMRLALKQGTQRVITRLAQCLQQAVDNNEIDLSDDVQMVTKELYYLWIGATLMAKVSHTPDAFDVASNALYSRLKVA